MKGKLISALIMVVLVAGCSSSQQKTVRHKTNSANVAYAPEWFNSPPAGNTNLFAVSTARSTHADYAIKKGLQNAYAEMSRIIQSHLNGVVLNLVEEYGDKYYNQIHDASQLTSNNSLAGIRIVKQEIYHDAPYYYSFFLAAIPVAGINNTMKERLNEINDLKGRVNFSKTLTAIDNGSDDLLRLVNLHRVSGKFRYPRWFLENKGQLVVGYAPKAYYKENAAAEALENGI